MSRDLLLATLLTKRGEAVPVDVIARLIADGIDVRQFV